MSEYDADTHKACFARWPSGVAVIGAVDPVGARAALTVSSLISLSLEPPLIAFALAASDPDDAVYLGATGFGATLLAEGEEAISNRFAIPGPDKLAGGGWRPGAITGAPVIEGRGPSIEARPHARWAIGDHQLIALRPIAAELGEPAPPLLYFDRGYRRIG